MNKDYGYVENNDIIYAPSSFRVKFPKKSEYTELHPELHPECYEYAVPHPFYPTEDNRPVVDEDHIVINKGWSFNKSRKVCIHNYEVIERTYTVEDYDKAMEDYITSVRCERGYTTREPSAYTDSKVERFHQDAIDWQEFIDDVMIYALEILNAAAQGREVPSIKKFIEDMPKCIWTISDGD